MRKYLLLVSLITGLAFTSATSLKAQAVELRLPRIKVDTNAVIPALSEREMQLMFSCSTLPALQPENERAVNEAEQLKFLRGIPEYKELSLAMHTNEVEALVATNSLYSKRTVSGGDPTYWLVTPQGENIFVMFAANGDCRGIQRMTPIPGDSLEQYLGKKEYEQWQAKRKRLQAKRDARKP